MRRGLHRARPPAPRQARNSRVSCCANAALPFCWSHCVCRLHADSEPRFARAHSGVAGWQGWGGVAGRCTVACTACRAGEDAAAAAPSSARPQRKLAHMHPPYVIYQAPSASGVFMSPFAPPVSTARCTRLRVWHVYAWLFAATKCFCAETIVLIVCFNIASAARPTARSLSKNYEPLF